MNPPDTAREAFFIEALGDMAELIARIEACTPALEASQREPLQGCKDLAQQATDLESRATAVTEGIKVVASKYIAHRVHEAARTAADAQVRAMEAAAQTLFRREIGPALERMARPLQLLVTDLMHRCGNRWESALNHAATAAVASSLTWWLAGWLHGH